MDMYTGRRDWTCHMWVDSTPKNNLCKSLDDQPLFLNIH